MILDLYREYKMPSMIRLMKTISAIKLLKCVLSAAGNEANFVGVYYFFGLF